jgi:alanyl aminopeptidase
VIELRATPHGEDLLELRPAQPLAAGPWRLELAYDGTLEQLSTAGAFRQVVDGKPYVFSQFESVYARRAFPCFDEPNHKVPWQLTLDVPTGQVALANTEAVRTEPLDAGHTRVTFAPTRPLPSYLVAFAVGPFELVPAGQTAGGAPIRVVTLAGRAADAAWAGQTTRRIVDILEGWFGTPYPFSKLDLLSIPLTVGFGAMENPGLVTFTETIILLDPKHTSRGREHEWVRTAGHELAHQWFGDLVTTAWWDDIWLNEGFADWMERKVAIAFDPSWHDELAAVDERGGALASDELVSARQIRQPIASADDILNAFDGITYQKGASVLDMFEAYLGPELFQRGVRAYLAKHAWGNATSADFVAAISEVAGRDVGPDLTSFLDQSGAPVITATLACRPGAPPALALTQQRYVPPGAPSPPPGRPWGLPVCVAYDRDGQRGEACGMLSAATGELALPAKACPRWVMPNLGGHGYYRVAFTAAEATALRDRGWGQLAGAERRILFDEVREAALLGRLPLPLPLSLIPKLMAHPDRFTVGDVVGLTSELRRFVPLADQRRVDAWVRATYGPAARALGVVPRKDDGLDAEAMRRTLVGVAGDARDPAIVAEAVKLAATWRDLPAGIRPLVLRLAADDPARFQALLAEVHHEGDRARRGELLAALAGVRDPTRQRAALALVLDTTLDVRETSWMLLGSHDDAAREIAEAFLRAHVVELLARLPSDETTGGAAALGWVVAAACRAESRPAAEAFLRETFGKLPGATREVAQQLESLDQCIAQRALLEPQLRGWIATLPR